MKDGLPLAAYDLAWRIAWGPLRALAALDGLFRRLRGAGLLPARWRAERRLADPPPGKAALPAIWLHAASLGESKGLWAVARSLAEGEGIPVCRIVLTAVTAEGADFLRDSAAEWEQRRERGRERGVAMEASLAPLDHPVRVERFLRAHRVAYVALYEADLWPNHIRVPARLGIPVDLLSARMSERAFRRALWFRRTWGGLLDRLGWILAQGEADAGRFRALSRAKTAVGGDFKIRHYLRSHEEAAGAPPRIPSRNLEAPSRDLMRFAFVSLHRAELELLLPELSAFMERFPVTLFPRRVEEMEAFRRALLPLGFRRHAEEPEARHVLVDALGLVGRLLPACGSAFVGGTWVPLGGHNLWEPLRAGLKVAVGPSTFNQEEPMRLAQARGLVTWLRAPADLREWTPPDPGHAERAAALVEEQVEVLEAAEARVRGRVADAVGGFYLFSGAAKDTLSS